MTSSQPLPAYTSRDDARFLTEEENEVLDEVLSATGHPRHLKMQLVPFLRDVEWDEEAAVERVQKYEAEMKMTPSIDVQEDILPFVNVDKEGVPLPCGVLLEDGRGQCARDKRGNPIVLVFGAFECDSTSAIKQMLHINERVKMCVDPRQILEITYVFDMGPRDGKHSVGNPLNIDFLRFTSIFPQSYSLHLCKASPKVVQAFSLLPPNMRSHIHICTDYSGLGKIIDESNMLPRWGGTFDFDLLKYRAFLSEYSKESSNGN